MTATICSPLSLVSISIQFRKENEREKERERAWNTKRGTESRTDTSVDKD